jgi:hypothetical protein
MLEAWCLYCDHGYEDMFKERISHSGVGGSNLQDFNKLAQLRKRFHLELDKSIIINQAQVECTRNFFVLDRFSLLPVSCVSWETGL